MAISTKWVDLGGHLSLVGHPSNQLLKRIDYYLKDIIFIGFSLTLCINNKFSRVGNSESDLII